MQLPFPLRMPDSFPLHGSSVSKGALGGGAGCLPQVAIALYSRAGKAGSILLTLLFLRCQKYLKFRWIRVSVRFDLYMYFDT